MATTAKKEDTETLYLFQDDEKYTAPLFVGVNGHFYMIKRGENVEVPKSVKEVVMNSEKQKKAAKEAQDKAKEVELIG